MDKRAAPERRKKRDMKIKNPVWISSLGDKKLDLFSLNLDCHYLHS